MVKLKSDSKRRAALTHQFKEMQAQGQGVYGMTFVTPMALIEMMLSHGEERIVRACLKLLTMIEVAQPPALCLLCQTEFGPTSLPAQILLVTPACDQPKDAVGHGICIRCEAGGDLPQRVIAYYRENLMSDARLLPRLAAPGRA